MRNYPDESDLGPGWLGLLKDEINAPYFLSLIQFIDQERKEQTIYPPENQVFEAFKKTQPEQVKAVIIGQDPYHGKGQAHGLCFSVPNGIAHPPSLKNIFKELKNDLGVAIPKSGDLSKWADQGVFLLNAILTVREGNAGSHQKKGWEQFTNTSIKKLSENHNGLVFILWGNYAQQKSEFIDTTRHYILTAAHPSPLSANRMKFFGTHPFSECNKLLVHQGKKPIDWKLE